MFGRADAHDQADPFKKWIAVYFSSLNFSTRNSVPVCKQRCAFRSRIYEDYFWCWSWSERLHLLIFDTVSHCFVSLHGYKLVAWRKNRRGFRSWPLSEINDSSLYETLRGEIHCSDITNDQFGISEETGFWGGNLPIYWVISRYLVVVVLTISQVCHTTFLPHLGVMASVAIFHMYTQFYHKYS